MIDYALWEVIENDAILPKIAVVEGVEKLKFNSVKDAKLLLEVVEKRFSGNATTKKTQRNLLKQQYENFTTPSQRCLDQTCDRLPSFQSGVCSNLPQEDIFARVVGAPRNQDNKKKESSRRIVHVETPTSIALVSCDGLGGYDWIPPPYKGNFMPPTLDLSFTGLDEFVNKHVVENRKSDEEVSKDSEEENVSQTKTEKKTVKPSIAKIEFVKPKQQEKTARKTVKQVKKLSTNTYSPRGNKEN
ncbi:hypothetical protein Tco_0806781 [Tanacetum coccineum]